jgi:hypothetical protein
MQLCARYIHRFVSKVETPCTSQWGVEERWEEEEGQTQWGAGGWVCDSLLFVSLYDT